MLAARGAARVAALAALITAGFATAAHRPITPVKPGERIELMTAAAKPVENLSYLASSLGVDEAIRLAPVTEQVAAVLRRYAKDDQVVDRAAQAVVVEGVKHKLEPSLLVGLMIIENAKIDPVARSNVGATGLMQVMPFHSGQWGCESADLVDIEANICHGANILAKYVRTSPNLDRALLRYNGCVRGRNTPNCHTYPVKVRGYATHASKMMATVEAGGDVRSIGLYPKLNLATAKKPVAKKRPTRANTRKT